MAGDELCKKCGNELPISGEYVKCSGGCLLHYGHNCAGITKDSWKSMSNPTKKAWKCEGCRQYKTRPKAADSLNTETEPVDISGLHNLIKAMNQSIIKMDSKLNNLMDLPSSFQHLEEAVNMMSDKYDEVLKINQNNKETVEMKKQLKQVTKELQEKNEVIGQL